MLLQYASPADARALDALRCGKPQGLRTPAELTRSLRAHYPSGPGYQFSWGQLIELPSDLPDPQTERYCGVSWAVIPVASWLRLQPRMRAAGVGPVHERVYVFQRSRVELARLVTLSDSDADMVRLWMAEQFIPHDLPRVLDAYERSLGEWVKCLRERWLDPATTEENA